MNEEGKKQRKPINFIITDDFLERNRFFDEHWVQVIIKQNPIKKPLAGLKNFGNSCFLNSVLQCLVYSPGLPFFAENIPHIIIEKSISRHSFLYHFGLLCKEMRVRSEVSPIIFYNNLSKICPLMNPGRQQDAHEFLLALLNAFDEECRRAWSKNHDPFDSAVHSLFGSTLLEVKICDQCKHVTYNTSHVLDICIPIDLLKRKEIPTIESCLKQFMTPSESVTGVNCEQCKKISTMSNKLIFKKTPYILIITMMRFSANGQKIENNVDFDFSLDINFCTEDSQHSLYELFAMIVHNGHHISNGHFTSAIKIGNAWYAFDDTKVTKVTEKSILLSRPYMLFYRREVVIEPVMVHFGASCDSEN